MRCLLLVGLTLAACSPPVRELEVVPSLPAGCLGGRVVNAVRVTALGDFPPQPASVTSATATGGARLSLPAGTRVILVEGIGPASVEGAGGVVAFGRSAPLTLDGEGTPFAGRIAVAYGPPDGLCATGPLSAARRGHRATLLASGQVLLTGGVGADGSAVTSLERYLPEASADGPAAGFVAVDPATRLDAQAAVGHAVVALPDGDAIVFGGAAAAPDGSGTGIASQGFLRLGPDGTARGAPGLLGGGPRAFHAATILGDGRVVLTGGCSELVSGGCADGHVLGSSTLYDPRTGLFSDGPPLLHPRWDHDAILRGDGSILLVGGRGADGTEPPLELFDPDERRPIEAGPGGGRAARLPTGTVLLTGGVAAADAQVSAWSADGRLALGRLGEPRRNHTVTALDDGAALIAGGAPDAALAVVDGRGNLRPLAARYGRTGHTATRLLDGSVLLAGGDAGAGASADAFVYLRSPLGPFSSLPALTFDAPAQVGDPFLPAPIDLGTVENGTLVLRAPQPGEGGRPGEIALVAGEALAGVGLTTFAGRRGAGALALVIGWVSEAEHVFVSVEPGQPVTARRVRSPRAGQSLVEPIAGCSGVAPGDAELPDGTLAPIALEARDGTLTVGPALARPWLTCALTGVARGQAGVGALRGTITVDDLAVSR